MKKNRLYQIISRAFARWPFTSLDLDSFCLFETWKHVLVSCETHPCAAGSPLVIHRCFYFNMLVEVVASTHTHTGKMQQLLRINHHSALSKDALEVDVAPVSADNPAQSSSSSDAGLIWFLRLRVYRAKYWSVKWSIMALQELLQKNPFCRIDCCNEDERWISRMRTARVQPCVFHAFVCHAGEPQTPTQCVLIHSH